MGKRLAVGVCRSRRGQATTATTDRISSRLVSNTQDAKRQRSAEEDRRRPARSPRLLYFARRPTLARLHPSIQPAIYPTLKRACPLRSSSAIHVFLACLAHLCTQVPCRRSDMDEVDGGAASSSNIRHRNSPSLSFPLSLSLPRIRRDAMMM
ncbi:hypothetical protein BKA80DRAFT_260040, partial [Phyllosticta citrichinensis]